MRRGNEVVFAVAKAMADLGDLPAEASAKAGGLFEK
jgi:hypothetical protein